MIHRICNLPVSQSFFLFGPRQTGKSTLVDHTFAKGAWKIDLLMTDVFLRYVKYPDLFRREALEKTVGNARSLSLDLYGQWKVMEEQGGKWRFTSPTHVVRAFQQAMHELEVEGGVKERAKRYAANQKLLVQGMEALGFQTFLQGALQSPIITTFLYPKSEKFDFLRFYKELKFHGFVIYPGKVSKADTFRIGTIGDVHTDDIERLLKAMKECLFWPMG